MSKYRGLYDFLSNNKQLPCNVGGCGGKRVGMSQYCSRHRSRAYVWGHPEAGPLKPHLYDQEIESVKNLLNKNDDHEGIVLGRNWLQKMMDLGNSGADIRASIYWANLCQQKVSPNAILIRLGGLWLFERRDEIRRHIKSDKHTTALTGHAVVRFGRMYGMKYVPPKIYRQVGDQVRSGIGPLLVNLCKGVEKIEGQQRENYIKMSRKLNTD
jgi:hypothetical protein